MLLLSNIATIALVSALCLAMLSVVALTFDKLDLGERLLQIGVILGLVTTLCFLCMFTLEVWK